MNLAVNGAFAKDLEVQLESRNMQTMIAQSNVIVISIGGNDLWSGANGLRRAPRNNPGKVMGETLDAVDRIVKKVRAANPRARIFLVGLYNPFVSAPFAAACSACWSASGRDGDQALRERYERDGGQTSDLFSHRSRLSLDNFHPDDEGYALIARRIAESL